MEKSFQGSKDKKIAEFDASDIGVLNGNLYSLPFNLEESEVVVVPMPWEVTVSYRAGTAAGPKTMLDASTQVDLYEPDIKDAWKLGVGMEKIPAEWMKLNKKLRGLAQRCIAHLEQGGSPTDTKVAKLYKEINDGGARLNEWTAQKTRYWLDKGKSVCVMGGEHSVPLGFMHTLAEKYPRFSILHIDAHADLREAYEGFEYSHASIMYNASKLQNVDRISLVGIRDYSEQEADRIAASRGRMVAFPDRYFKRKAYEGVAWRQLCREITTPLSQNVYISFDIDALDPALCPHTGTPVPGGLEFEQVMYLIEMLVARGKKIIGFDLCEVAPGPGDDWDSIVGVRALYRLALLMAKSQGKI